MTYPPGFVPSSCPILDDTCIIRALSLDLAKTLRKLRRDLEACKTCICVDDCPVLQNFKTTINTAISEVTQELELTIQ